MRLRKELSPIIEANLTNMTALEQDIALFFLQQEQLISYSIAAVAKQLHVSKATLTRFSKKCGFTGFREFLFQYKEMIQAKEEVSIYKDLTQQVLVDYEEVLKKTYSVLNEQQLERITRMMKHASRIYFYGKGSSALALMEMKIRFMRLGIVGEVISDEDVLLWNRFLVDESCLVIGASISGKTTAILAALEEASQKGAKTVLMTSQNLKRESVNCDELLLLASCEHLSQGNRISPQFPILVMIDFLFSYYLSDFKKERYYDQTIIHKGN